MAQRITALISIAAFAAASCWRDTTCNGPSEASFSGPWEANILSPSSRFIHPKSVVSLSSGQVISAYEDGTQLALNGSQPSIVLDFGLEVGGIVSFDYILSQTGNVSLGLAFTEAKDFIGKNSDSSRGGSGGRPGDGPLLATLSSAGSGYYSMPIEKLRGGFRYMTSFIQSAEAGIAVTLTNITLEIGFQPTWSNLRAYQGYFHSEDELLNNIWYSGAYTVQTNSAPGNTGQNRLPGSERGWRNNGVITSADTVLLDGAKRDRFVWIGDMGTAVPSAFTGTGDLDSTRYALLAIYDNQRSDGMFPKAGPPYVVLDSDTYHLWAMIGTYNYFLYSGDAEFAANVWSKFEAATDYALSLITTSGIVKVKQAADWGRQTFANERASASMLLYRALVYGGSMASWLEDRSMLEGRPASSYKEKADLLREAILTELWDEEVGAFTDSPKNATLYPQDANSMALAFGVLANDTERIGRVTDYLASNWTPIGPSCPELPKNVSPFMSSIELEAHFRAGRPDRALELMRSLWGWYLSNENGTQSTTPEGFLIDGSWHYRFNKGYSNGPAYMSHAHCWSSGPTSTLTEHMLGLHITKPAGEDWQLKPASFNELSSFEAGFTTKLGKFSAKVTVEGDRATIEWNTPKGTKGLLALPGEMSRQVPGGEGKTTISIK